MIKHRRISPCGWHCSFSQRRPRRARPCNRPCAGAHRPRGSSIIAISKDCRAKRSRAGGPRSTPRKPSPRLYVDLRSRIGYSENLFRPMFEKMGGGRRAQPFTNLPPGATGGTQEHLKFAQLPFEEMGGTPIEHIAMQYP